MAQMNRKQNIRSGRSTSANVRRPVNRRSQAARAGNPPTKVIKSFHGRAIKKAWRQFHDGSLSHWITTLVIALSLTIYGVFALIIVNATQSLESWQHENLVTIFMKSEATSLEGRLVKKRLVALPEVENLIVVPPELALSRLKAMLGTEAGLLDELDENPLPTSLEFRFAGVDGLETVVAEQLTQKIAGWPGVEAVSFDREWVDRLSAIIQAFRLGGNIISGLLLVAVAFIISNTIKLTIMARSDEVEVMRFMGATDAFIKIPFLYEGVLQGLFGAVISLILTLGLYFIAIPATHELGRSFGVNLTLQPLPLEQMAFIAALGVALGLAGALISVSRFMEV